MTEEPVPERASVMSAGAQRIRAGLATAGSAVTRPLERLRHGGETSEIAEKPKPVGAAVSDEVQRIRTELAEAGIATRRMLERANWARLIIVGVVQVVIALIAWRISVRRDRRRRRQVQLWVDHVLNGTPD